MLIECTLEVAPSVARVTLPDNYAGVTTDSSPVITRSAIIGLMMTPHIKKIKESKKIRVDESILETPIDIKEEFYNSLVVFDDIEHFDKEIANELMRLRNISINAGRHCGIDTIVCRQNFLEGNLTKTPLNSAFQIIGFPKTASRYQLASYWTRYLHFDSKMIKKILALSSRWVMINTTLPMFCMWQNGIFLIEEYKETI